MSRQVSPAYVNATFVTVDRPRTVLPVDASPRFPVMAAVLAGLLLLGVGVFAYWPTLVELAERWNSDPQYSHGFIVPAFAAFLLWRNRQAWKEAKLRPSWWGVGLLLVALGLRMAGSAYFLNGLEPLSLILYLTGLTLVIGGRAGLGLAWPALLYLVFMVPLPFRLQTALGGSLQAIATQAGTFTLQTLGVPAVAEGNVILLTTTRIGVVEACSGLSMLMTFFALAGALVLWLRPAWYESMVILVAAAPIAVLANVLRIVVTGVLYETSNDRMARVVFHDLAGWLMMPLALVLLGGVLWLTRRLIVPVQRAQALRDTLMVSAPPAR